MNSSLSCKGPVGIRGFYSFLPRLCCRRDSECDVACYFLSRFGVAAVTLAGLGAANRAIGSLCLMTLGGGLFAGVTKSGNPMSLIGFGVWERWWTLRPFGLM
jgi:hypothetical protein